MRHPLSYTRAANSGHTTLQRSNSNNNSNRTSSHNNSRAAATTGTSSSSSSSSRAPVTRATPLSVSALQSVTAATSSSQQQRVSVATTTRAPASALTRSNSSSGGAARAVAPRLRTHSLHTRPLDTAPRDVCYLQRNKPSTPLPATLLAATTTTTTTTTEAVEAVEAVEDMTAVTLLSQPLVATPSTTTTTTTLTTTTTATAPQATATTASATTSATRASVTSERHVRADVRAQVPVAHIRIRPLLTRLGERNEQRRVFFLDHENLVVVLGDAMTSATTTAGAGVAASVVGTMAAAAAAVKTTTMRRSYSSTSNLSRSSSSISAATQQRRRRDDKRVVGNNNSNNATAGTAFVPPPLRKRRSCDDVLHGDDSRAHAHATPVTTSLTTSATTSPTAARRAGRQAAVPTTSSSSVDNNNGSSAAAAAAATARRHYSFEFVHDEDATQEDVFEESVLTFVDEALMAHNVAILCYGPTGSGKTYSMMGSDVSSSSNNSNNNNNVSAALSSASSPLMVMTTMATACADDDKDNDHDEEEEDEDWPRVLQRSTYSRHRTRSSAAAAAAHDDDGSARTTTTTASQSAGAGTTTTSSLVSISPASSPSASPCAVRRGSGSHRGSSSSHGRGGGGSRSRSAYSAVNTAEMGILPRLVCVLLDRRGVPVVLTREHSIVVSNGSSSSSNNNGAVAAADDGQAAAAAAAPSSSPSPSPCSSPPRHATLTLRSIAFYGVELYMDVLYDLLDPAKRPVHNVSDVGGLSALCQRLDSAADEYAQAQQQQVQQQQTQASKPSSRRNSLRPPPSSSATTTSAAAAAAPAAATRRGGGICLQTLADLRYAYDVARRNRVTTSHRQNDTSSRSHALFVLKLHFTLHSDDVASDNNNSNNNNNDSNDSNNGSKDNDEHVCSYVTLVDLAGCERVKETKVSGAALREAQYINRSLSALSSVVLALYQRTAHVPYRDAKLTRLLRPCLQGGRVLTLVHVSPCSSLAAVNTLQFADQIRHTRVPTHSLGGEAKRGLLTRFEDLMLDAADTQLAAALQTSVQAQRQLCAEVRLAYLTRYATTMTAATTTAAATGAAAAAAQADKDDDSRCTTPRVASVLCTRQRSVSASDTHNDALAAATAEAALSRPPRSVVEQLVRQYIAPLFARDAAQQRAAEQRIAAECTASVAATRARLDAALTRTRHALAAEQQRRTRLLHETATLLATTCATEQPRDGDAAALRVVVADDSIDMHTSAADSTTGMVNGHNDISTPTPTTSVSYAQQLRTLTAASEACEAERQTLHVIVAALRQRVAMQDELEGAVDAALQQVRQPDDTTMMTAATTGAAASSSWSTSAMATLTSWWQRGNNKATQQQQQRQHANQGDDGDDSGATSLSGEAALALPLSLSSASSLPPSPSSLALALSPPQQSLSTLPVHHRHHHSSSTADGTFIVDAAHNNNNNGGGTVPCEDVLLREQMLLTCALAALRDEASCFVSADAILEGLWARALRSLLLALLARESAAMTATLLDRRALTAWVLPRCARDTRARLTQPLRRHTRDKSSSSSSSEDEEDEAAAAVAAVVADLCRIAQSSSSSSPQHRHHRHRRRPRPWHSTALFGCYDNEAHMQATAVSCLLSRPAQTLHDSNNGSSSGGGDCVATTLLSMQCDVDDKSSCVSSSSSGGGVWCEACVLHMSAVELYTRHIAHDVAEERRCRACDTLHDDDSSSSNHHNKNNDEHSSEHAATTMPCARWGRLYLRRDDDGDNDNNNSSVTPRLSLVFDYDDYSDADSDRQTTTTTTTTAAVRQTLFCLPLSDAQLHVHLHVLEGGTTRCTPCHYETTAAAATAAAPTTTTHNAVHANNGSNGRLRHRPRDNKDNNNKSRRVPPPPPLSQSSQPLRGARVSTARLLCRRHDGIQLLLECNNNNNNSSSAVSSPLLVLLRFAASHTRGNDDGGVAALHNAEVVIAALTALLPSPPPPPPSAPQLSSAVTHNGSDSNCRCACAPVTCTSTQLAVCAYRHVPHVLLAYYDAAVQSAAAAAQEATATARPAAAVVDKVISTTTATATATAARTRQPRNMTRTTPMTATTTSRTHASGGRSNSSHIRSRSSNNSGNNKGKSTTLATLSSLSTTLPRAATSATMPSRQHATATSQQQQQQQRHGNNVAVSSHKDGSEAMRRLRTTTLCVHVYVVPVTHSASTLRKVSNAVAHALRPLCRVSPALLARQRRRDLHTANATVAAATAAAAAATHEGCRRRRCRRVEAAAAAARSVQRRLRRVRTARRRARSLVKQLIYDAEDVKGQPAMMSSNNNNNEDDNNNDVHRNCDDGGSGIVAHLRDVIAEADRVLCLWQTADTLSGNDTVDDEVAVAHTSSRAAVRTDGAYATSDTSLRRALRTHVAHVSVRDARVRCRRVLQWSVWQWAYQWAALCACVTQADTHHNDKDDSDRCSGRKETTRHDSDGNSGHTRTAAAAATTSPSRGVPSGGLWSAWSSSLSPSRATSSASPQREQQQQHADVQLCSDDGDSTSSGDNSSDDDDDDTSSDSTHNSDDSSSSSRRNDENVDNVAAVQRSRRAASSSLPPSLRSSLSPRRRARRWRLVGIALAPLPVFLSEYADAAHASTAATTTMTTGAHVRHGLCYSNSSSHAGTATTTTARYGSTCASRATVPWRTRVRQWLQRHYVQHELRLDAALDRDIAATETRARAILAYHEAMRNSNSSNSSNNDKDKEDKAVLSSPLACERGVCPRSVLCVPMHTARWQPLLRRCRPDCILVDLGDAVSVGVHERSDMRARVAALILRYTRTAAAAADADDDVVHDDDDDSDTQQQQVRRRRRLRCGGVRFVVRVSSLARDSAQALLDLDMVSSLGSSVEAVMLPDVTLDTHTRAVELLHPAQSLWLCAGTAQSITQATALCASGLYSTVVVDAGALAAALRLSCGCHDSDTAAYGVQDDDGDDDAHLAFVSQLPLLHSALTVATTARAHRMHVLLDTSAVPLTTTMTTTPSSAAASSATQHAAVTRSLRRCRALGFDGAVVAHPAHVTALHTAYALSSRELQWVQRVHAAVSAAQHLAAATDELCNSSSNSSDKDDNNSSGDVGDDSIDTDMQRMRDYRMHHRSLHHADIAAAAAAIDADAATAALPPVVLDGRCLSEAELCHAARLWVLHCSAVADAHAAQSPCSLVCTDTDGSDDNNNNGDGATVVDGSGRVRRRTPSRQARVSPS